MAVRDRDAYRKGRAGRGVRRHCLARSFAAAVRGSAGTGRLAPAAFLAAALMSASGAGAEPRLATRAQPEALAPGAPRPNVVLFLVDLC